jgi:nucleoside-diphosphate-sugar epimerase
MVISPRVSGRADRPAPDARGGTVVAVLAAAGPLVQPVLTALLTAPGVRSVVAVTPEAPDSPQLPAGVERRTTDLAGPSLAEALAGADVAVHIAASADLAAELGVPARARREHALRRAQAAITAAAAAGVSHLVVVGSAMVHGARPDNPVPLDEDAPLRAPADEGVVAELMDVEQLVAVAREVHPGLLVTSVRPAALVGPGVDTVITRHFEAPRLLVVKGAGPAWQFCHVDDLGTAVAAVACSGGSLGPAVTVGCDGVLPQTRVEQLSGMRRIELSLGVAQGTAQRLHRVGVLPAAPSDLEFALYPWAISSRALRAAGWRPAYDNETCLGVLLDGVRGSHALAARRVDRRDAALGAASAAVALVGTAALLRRRRRRGGRS